MTSIRTAPTQRNRLFVFVKKDSATMDLAAQVIYFQNEILLFNVLLLSWLCTAVFTLDGFEN